MNATERIEIIPWSRVLTFESSSDLGQPEFSRKLRESPSSFGRRSLEKLAPVTEGEVSHSQRRRNLLFLRRKVDSNGNWRDIMSIIGYLNVNYRTMRPKRAIFERKVGNWWKRKQYEIAFVDSPAGVTKFLRNKR